MDAPLLDIQLSTIHRTIPERVVGG